MTYSCFLPIGNTFEARMQYVLRRREKWLLETGAKSCVVIVHKNNFDDIGFWLRAHGVAYTVLAHGGPLVGEIGFIQGGPAETLLAKGEGE